MRQLLPHSHNRDTNFLDSDIDVFKVEVNNKNLKTGSNHEQKIVTHHWNFKTISKEFKDQWRRNFNEFLKIALYNK